jgi:N-succinyldiaminopimelate aminotransferase
MNPDLSHLQPYPFERLAKLLDGVSRPQTLSEISLSIGEPKHPTPGFITEEVITHLHGLSRYPLLAALIRNSRFCPSTVRARPCLPLPNA